MKKGLIIVGIILAVLLAVCGAALIKAGIFTDVTADIRELPEREIAYSDFTGPYKNTGPAMDAVYESLKSDGISAATGAGLYYDNPAVVPADKLRSRVGAVIDGKNKSAFDRVRAKYATMKIPAGRYVYAEFPRRNILSYMIGPMRVYPVIEK
ncbi:MAG: GyrI-like domain-containing protein, partial [Spirochaetota bacterium]